MPSHKHKKKKKNHKKCKRKGTSSSDDENFWMLSLSESDNDESQSGEILTSLVRRSYMKHLQQVLIENFKMGKSPTELCQNSVQELASKWASILEKKALRASMLSEMYRRNMVSSIKDIEAKTSERRIYVDEKMLSKIKLFLSKETQTDDFGNHCDAEIQTDVPHPKPVSAAETQTDGPLPTLLELPLPKTLVLSPPSRPYDPAINFSDSCPSSPGVSSTQPQPITTIITSAHQDICSITSTSDLVLASGPVSKGRDDILTLEHKIFTDTRLSEVNIGNAENLLKATSTTCDTNIKVNDPRHKLSNNSNLVSHEENSKSTNVRCDLNTRLNAMGLLNGTETEMDIEKSKKSNWYAEEVAQSCNLTRILLRMTARQRERVLIKFKKLFGDENELLTEISEENIMICRKRIATVVVMELTPLYQDKRIASRYLFKYVAKKITKALMEQSYAPDSRSIRQKVKEFFKNGRVVMSEADCM